MILIGQLREKITKTEIRMSGPVRIELLHKIQPGGSAPSRMNKHNARSEVLIILTEIPT